MLKYYNNYLPSLVEFINSATTYVHLYMYCKKLPMLVFMLT